MSSDLPRPVLYTLNTVERPLSQLTCTLYRSGLPEQKLAEKLGSEQLFTPVRESSAVGSVEARQLGS